MQKLLKKNDIAKKPNLINDKNRLTIEAIENFVYRKRNRNFLIGLEYERLSLDEATYLNADYKSVSTIVRLFATISNWEIIYDNDTLIGAISKNSTSLSLEPGCQLEISIAPKKTILEIDLELSNIIELLNNIAKPYNIKFIGYGISPKSSADSIALLEKQRYKIMNDYLPNCKDGELCAKMMRQTAGIQVNIDYSNKKDAYLKLKFLNMIMPFVSGMCSNSPIEKNTLSDYKSTRIHTWLYTGKQRCGIFYKNIFENEFFKYKLSNYKNFFKNYIQEILKVPMVYIERNGKNIPINGVITFEEFIKNGYLTYSATMEDYILHQSLCFPDIRLKKYIEIRNHDSNNPKKALALCAFYKGLMQNKPSSLINKFNYINLADVEFLNKQVAKNGLDFEYKNIPAWEIVGHLYNLAVKKLDAKERAYLKPIYDILTKRKTDADIILDMGIEKVSDLIEFLS